MLLPSKKQKNLGFTDFQDGQVARCFASFETKTS